MPTGDDAIEAAPAASIVITAYNESGEHLDATVRACLGQTAPVARVVVVDDGSPAAVCLGPSVTGDPRLTVLRLADNVGIAAARNAGLATVTTPYVACVNVEVVLRSDWVAATTAYLRTHPRVGAVCSRMTPADGSTVWTRWRYRMHEEKFQRDPTVQDGPVPMAPGHAVMFRRPALIGIGGYDPRFKRNFEDGDVCQRLRAAGHDTHLTLATSSVSIQVDSGRLLARKELGRGGWNLGDGVPFSSAVRRQTRVFAEHVGRNLLKGRLQFALLDFYVWMYGLRLLYRARR